MSFYDFQYPHPLTSIRRVVVFPSSAVHREASSEPHSVQFRCTKNSLTWEELAQILTFYVKQQDLLHHNVEGDIPHLACSVSVCALDHTWDHSYLRL